MKNICLAAKQVYLCPYSVYSPKLLLPFTIFFVRVCVCGGITWFASCYKPSQTVKLTKMFK